MPVSININEFLAAPGLLIDVRSHGEFNSGHIPGAVNIPLFNDEERKIVGTLYKQSGKEPAVLKGLEIVGPKLKEIVAEVNKITENKNIRIYCWRGGMRSASVAWLLEVAGYKATLLKGGYKSFRRKTVEVFAGDWNLKILGGRTGSGKTFVLEELAGQGEQVIDLERLANHKGSSFGSLGEKSQPTQEHFENLLANELLKQDKTKAIWIEDESRLVGNKVIPGDLWSRMRNSPVVYLDIPIEERVNYLVKEYGKFPGEELKSAIDRIHKRLGGLNTKRALEAIDSNDLKTACEISLEYYDKSYDHGVGKREPSTIRKHTFEKLDFKNIAVRIIEYSESVEA